MMKRFFLFAFLLFAGAHAALGQKSKVDSLIAAYKKNRQDTTLVQLLLEKNGSEFSNDNPDSLFAGTNKALVLARKIHYQHGEVEAMSIIANALNRRGDLPGSLRMTFGLLPKAIAIRDERAVAAGYNALGLDYAVLKDYKKSLSYFIMAKDVVVKARIQDLGTTVYNNIAKQDLDMGKLDSAQYFTNKAYQIAVKSHDANIGYPIRNFGIIQVLKGNYAKGIDFFRKSIGAFPKRGNHYLLSEDYRWMALAYQKLSRKDSCIYFAKKAYDEAELDKDPNMVMKSTNLLTDEYRSLNDYKDAYDYEQIMLKANDSLFSQQKTLVIQNLTFAQEQHKQEAQEAEIAYQNRVRFYAMLGIVGFLVLIAAILLYANGRRKKANAVLQKTLSALKTTQRQLIQSEKMASLGELTAGIAHEIQNPLNFVNNFAEINIELLDEMESELKSGDKDEALAIASDVRQNLEKIRHHGQRADGIVKGMLQHSRASSNTREPTDVNKLADEYLRLAYHGLRAKDKSFNAELETNFDTGLLLANLVPQDIGRVLLNLFTNAFYATEQKKKLLAGNYSPVVAVSTAIANGQIEIRVRDNGIGIPENIKEKIMQPFFTTKPTGEGTGLGLSLTYDIVVKGHGGKIDINTKEGEFTEFIVTLPL